MGIDWGEPGYTEPTLLPHLVEHCPPEGLVGLCRTAAGFGYGSLGLVHWPLLAEVVLHAVAKRCEIQQLVAIGLDVPSLLAHTPLDVASEVAGSIIAALPDGHADVEMFRRAELAARAAVLDAAHLDVAMESISALPSWFSRDSPRGLIVASMGSSAADRFVAEEDWTDLPIEQQVAVVRAVGTNGMAEIRSRILATEPRSDYLWATWGGLYPWLDGETRAQLRSLGSALISENQFGEWYSALVAAAIAPDLEAAEREQILTAIAASDRDDPLWRAHLDAIVIGETEGRIAGAHPRRAVTEVESGCRDDPSNVMRLIEVMWDRWAGAPPPVANPARDDGLSDSFAGGEGVLEPIRKSDESDDAPARPRYVNVCFVRERAGEPVPRVLSLATARRYFVRIDIGDLDADSLVDNPGHVPVEHLPATDVGHWIRVAVLSDGVKVAAGEFAIFLPVHGPAWVCDCEPDADHVCTPSQRDRFVFVAVTTPHEAKAARLRIAIYHRANVLQSFDATVTIRDVEEPATPATIHMDFSLSNDLSAVGDLPARDVNLLTDTNGATHTLTVSGATGGIFTATLGDDARAILTKAARETLLAVHVEQVETGVVRKRVELRNRYAADNAAPSLDRFRADLRLVAPIGRRAWDELLGSLLSTPDIPFALAGRSGIRIQVATPPTSRFGFPWALVYDVPLGTDPTRFRDCSVLDRWDLSATEPPTGPDGGCPDAASHDADTICPFGFWGFRHLIEQPLPSPSGNLTRTVGLSDDASAVVCAGTDGLLAEEAADHIVRVKATLGWPVSECSRRDELSTALRREGIAVSYFFCHGRSTPETATGRSSTYLELGSDETIAAGDLMAWDQLFGLDHWKSHGPLVFLNGCHTADVTPESVTDLVTGFARLGASGVVGTETTVHQHVAARVAEEFWRELVDGQRSIGETMRAVRRRLLARGNLMGLAYTAFCADDLTLVAAPRP